jgi:hypothetical protein
MIRVAGILLHWSSVGIFVLVTVVLGGLAAFFTGRAIAATWRPWWHVALYMLVLAGAVRFLHMALFAGPLLSLPHYLGDLAVCLAFGFWGYRATRARQMVRQYGWLYRRAGLLGWTRRGDAPHTAETEWG